MQIISNVNSSTLPIIIKIIKNNLVKDCNSWKLKYSMPYIEELTVFIKAKMDSLNELSKEISEIVRKEVSKNKDIINIITDKKYFWISDLWKLTFKKRSLFKKIFFGLTWEIRSLIENLNKE